jgi:hypothetical protein
MIAAIRMAATMADARALAGVRSGSVRTEPDLPSASATN